MTDNGILVLAIMAALVAVIIVAVALLRRRLTPDQAAQVGAVAAAILAALGTAFDDATVRAVAREFYRAAVHSTTLSEEAFVEIVMRMVKLGRSQSPRAEQFAVAALANADAAKPAQDA